MSRWIRTLPPNPTKQGGCNLAVYGPKRELPGTAIQLHRPIDFALSGMAKYVMAWHGMAWQMWLPYIGAIRQGREY